MLHTLLRPGLVKASIHAVAATVQLAATQTVLGATIPTALVVGNVGTRALVSDYTNVVTGTITLRMGIAFVHMLLDHFVNEIHVSNNSSTCHLGVSFVLTLSAFHRL